MQGVLGSADKGFDAQVLLDGLEEQLDLPALVVDLGDGGGRQVEAIGEVSTITQFSPGVIT